MFASISCLTNLKNAHMKYVKLSERILTGLADSCGLAKAFLAVNNFQKKNHRTVKLEFRMFNVGF